jgi:hypothetical protein
VRINFRLGASTNWTETDSCYPGSALELYDTVVNNARMEGLQVMGLLSNESWPGTQAEWQANNAERNPGKSGDNPYLVAFSKNAAVVLGMHFNGKVAAWEVWNEPNAYSSYSPEQGYTGSTFIYPSNFAWLLRHVYEEAENAGITDALFVSGGVFGRPPPADSTGPASSSKRHPQTPGYAAQRTRRTAQARAGSVAGRAEPTTSLNLHPRVVRGWGLFQAGHGSAYPLMDRQASA